MLTEGAYDIGMIGIGTMGKALLLNMVDNGYRVAGYTSKADKAASLSEGIGEEKLKGFSEVEQFIQSLKTPRSVFLLVPAGPPVDETIEKLLPFLEPNDLIIDGGNSYYKDTDRREKHLEELGFAFIGMGVSGGEDGARHGPSMMPGGKPVVYDRVKPIFEAISAKYEGAPCVALLGKGSAGHYVKMVHNGIEYGAMQLIAETYDLMSRGLGLSAQEAGDRFAKLNEGILGGFLVEIAATVLREPDDKDPARHLVDVISDKAKQKGTGKWTSQDAMDLGIPVPTIDAAVNARELSSLKPQRVEAAKLLSRKTGDFPLDKDQTLAWAEQALHLAILISYAQGFALIAAADEEYGYETELETVAKIWRNGCIIRSKLLEPCRAAFERNPKILNLLLDEEIVKTVEEEKFSLRSLTSTMILASIPCPAFAACVSYLDGFSSERLPANLIQGQRDLFGAHTYERLDEEGSFHTHWK
jgi:6-phosphogluconate dehydrogenase